LAKLKSEYGFKSAKHPMVGNPCSRTVFDPLRMAPFREISWCAAQLRRDQIFAHPSRSNSKYEARTFSPFGRNSIQCLVYGFQLFVRAKSRIVFKCKAANFLVHFSGEHQGNHSLVGPPGPQRMLKRGGAVMFDKEV